MPAAILFCLSVTVLAFSEIKPAPAPCQHQGRQPELRSRIFSPVCRPRRKPRNCDSGKATSFQQCNKPARYLNSGVAGAACRGSHRGHRGSQGEAGQNRKWPDGPANDFGKPAGEFGCGRLPCCRSIGSSARPSLRRFPTMKRWSIWCVTRTRRRKPESG